MAVLTISREFGSLGDSISNKVSEALGYQLANKHMIEKVMREYGFVLFENVYNKEHSFWDRYDEDNSRIINFLNSTILAFASLDNVVILGRGGFSVLRDFDNALNILIRCPIDVRAENLIADGRAKNKDEALSIIKLNDKIRRKFLKTFYETNGNSTNEYNIVIDTSKVSADNAAEFIISTAKSLSSKKGEFKNDGFDTTLLNCVKKVIKRD